MAKKVILIRGGASDNPDDPTYILNVALPADNAAKFHFLSL